MASKKEIRKYVFAKRKEMTQEEADRLSLSIYEKVIGLPEFREASCIYAYVDYNKEASTREIIKKAWAEGKRVAVPKVTGPHEMKYYYLEDFSQLKPGYFQIPEPEDCPEAAEEDAFLIVPGVAFDETVTGQDMDRDFMTGILQVIENIRPPLLPLSSRSWKKCRRKRQMFFRIR